MNKTVLVIELDPSAGNTIEEEIADLENLGFKRILVAEGHVADRILESCVVEDKS